MQRNQPSSKNPVAQQKPPTTLFIDWDDPKCAITGAMFKSPVPLGCGHVCEEAAITAWKKSCPECRAPLVGELNPDLTILDKIFEYALQKKNYTDHLLQYIFQKNLPENNKHIDILIDMLIAQPDKLNKIAVYDEVTGNELEPGNFTTMYMLAFSSKGLAILENDDLRLNIDPMALNHIIPQGEEQDRSAVFWLAATEPGQQLLLKDGKLREKISPTTLNKIISKDKKVISKDKLGNLKGQSAVFNLCLTKTGREILHADKNLRMKISSETLNYVIPDGPYKGQSAALVLAQYANGRSLLLTTELGKKLQPEFLKYLKQHEEKLKLSDSQKPTSSASASSPSASSPSASSAALFQPSVKPSAVPVVKKSPLASTKSNLPEKK